MEVPLDVVGIDGHKKTYTLVAVDPLGCRRGGITVVTMPTGHQQAVRWISQFGQVLLAIEDCRHLTRRFEADLLLVGHAAVRVHMRLMAGARRSETEWVCSGPLCDVLRGCRASGFRQGRPLLSTADVIACVVTRRGEGVKRY